jgi:MFS family permease
MAIIAHQANATHTVPAVYNKSYVYLAAMVVALGGVLFGFDLVIISGTVPFFTKHFNLSEVSTGWAVGCLNLGAAAGALIAGKLSDAIGRKKLLLICAFLFAVTGLLQGGQTTLLFLLAHGYLVEWP